MYVCKVCLRCVYLPEGAIIRRTGWVWGCDRDRHTLRPALPETPGRETPGGRWSDIATDLRHHTHTHTHHITDLHHIISKKIPALCFRINTPASPHQLISSICLHELDRVCSRRRNNKSCPSKGHVNYITHPHTQANCMQLAFALIETEYISGDQNQLRINST